MSRARTRLTQRSSTQLSGYETAEVRTFAEPRCVATPMVSLPMETAPAIDVRALTIAGQHGAIRRQSSERVAVTRLRQPWPSTGTAPKNGTSGWPSRSGRHMTYGKWSGTGSRDGPDHPQSPSERPRRNSRKRVPSGVVVVLPATLRATTSPPGARDTTCRCLEIVKLDADGPVATSVPREDPRRDPSTDGFDGNRHAGSRLVEAHVDGRASRIRHRNLPESPLERPRAGSAGPPQR